MINLKIQKNKIIQIMKNNRFELVIKKETKIITKIILMEFIIIYFKELSDYQTLI